MPLLQQVEDDPFAPQLQPVDHDPFNPSPADVASMTHYPAGPNPAKPIIDAVKAFASGGLQGVANVQGMSTPAWSRRLGSILTSPEANAALGIMTPVGTKGITAFHGSPHDFDAFDISKIGSGEGAQAYGHGLYFAESERVAQDYRDKLSDNNFRIQSPDGDSFGHKELADAVRMETNPSLADDAREGWDWAFRNFAEQSGKFNIHPGKSAEFHQGYDSAKGLLQEHGFVPVEPGRMYQVSINADPEHFLDWDKPLSEQSPHVRSILGNLGIKETVPTERYGDLPLYGQHVSDRIANDVLPLGQATEENITKTLRAAGIPGIKYLDQGSRGAGNGTRNYVVFDDKLISIMKKYGIAGLGALPAMGAYHFQTTPGDGDPFAQ
jgi:hypothetical protein